VVEAYGARLTITAPDRDALKQLMDGMPEGWVECPDVDPASVEWRFAVMPDGSNGYRVRDGDGVQTVTHDLDLALGLMQLQMRRFVGYHAQELVFIHAGVVAYGGRGVVIPGHSFSGKSTLVAALVRQGAVFYSDEYAVLDENGLLHPYREPLVLREMAERRRIRLTAEELGGRAGDDPVAIGVVAFATYVPGAHWAPQESSQARGLFGLLEHAIPVQDRPQQTLAVLRKGLENAVILAGERGEAGETAKLLLETI
jgi:hypothetical protein